MTAEQFKLVIGKAVSALVEDDLDRTEQIMESLTPDELWFIKEVSENLHAAAANAYSATGGVHGA